LSESEPSSDDENDDTLEDMRLKSLRLKLKLLRRKQGAPGPPNRISAPLLTLCGTTTPLEREPHRELPDPDVVAVGEGIRVPLT
jgi:hypothetical protein